jgi:ComF family protein
MAWKMEIMPLPALLTDLVELCYPSRCAACGADCPVGTRFCEGCDGKLSVLERAPACRACASPLGEAGAPCPYCRGKSVRPFARLVAMGVYRPPLQGLIQQAKYRRRWLLAEALADRLLTLESVKGLLTEADCLAPVPLHWGRQIRRGYNQSAVIADRLSRKTGLPVVWPAARLRRTAPQTSLHARANRWQNLRHAFGLIDPASIRGKHVVIVDDVMTTLATIKAFGRVLRQAEPASICGIVLAMADPRRKDFTTI